MVKIKGWEKVKKNIWENNSYGYNTRIFLTRRSVDDWKNWFVFVKRKRFHEEWDDAENIVTGILPFRTNTKQDALNYAYKYMRSHPNG